MTTLEYEKGHVSNVEIQKEKQSAAKHKATCLKNKAKRKKKK